MKKLLLFLFLLSSAIAGIQSIRIVSVVEPPFVRETLVLGVKNDRSIMVHGASFALPLDSEVIKAEDKYGPLPYELVTTDKTIITYNFTVPLQPDEERILSYEFITRENLEKTDSGYTYQLYFVPPGNLPVEHMLEIPAGYQVDDNSVSPEANITRMNGKTYINWKIDSVVGDETKFTLSFSGKPLLQLPAGMPPWLMGIAVVVVLVLAWFIRQFISRPAEYIPEKIATEKVSAKMEQFDQKIIDLVTSSPGINQYELVKSLNMSKVTLSKRVTSLVKQGILRKERKGKRNYLYPKA